MSAEELTVVNVALLMPQGRVRPGSAECSSLWEKLHGENRFLHRDSPVTTQDKDRCSSARHRVNSEVSELC